MIYKLTPLKRPCKSSRSYHLINFKQMKVVNLIPFIYSCSIVPHLILPTILEFHEKRITIASPLDSPLDMCGFSRFNLYRSSAVVQRFWFNHHMSENKRSYIRVDVTCTVSIAHFR